MTEPLYRIEEESTEGWTLVSDDCKRLSKEECKVKLNDLIQNGINPNYVRLVRDV